MGTQPFGSLIGELSSLLAVIIVMPPILRSDMPSNDPDLHQNAPDNSGVALLIIDMINDLEFDGGEQVLQPAIDAAQHIGDLKRRLQKVGIPIIYANDNFGRWRSDFREAVRHCLEDGVRGAPIAQLLKPGPDDYFVLKPKHSAFFATALELLLTYLGCRRLILTGMSANMCVQFSAADAFMRDFHLQVPADCIASQSLDETRRALTYMQTVLGVDISPSADIDPDTVLPDAVPETKPKLS
jgi:nicotinamidase-related amidase